MVSAVSLGAEHLQTSEFEAVDEVFGRAIERGMNYADVFMAQAGVRDHIGRTLKGRREKMLIGGHIGSVLTDDGQYERSRDVSKSVAHVHDLLKRMQTDVLDVLYLHFIDEQSDLDRVLNEGMLEAAQKIIRDGKARYLGVSSHVPNVAREAVATGLIDVLMFPVNPLHDLLSSQATIDDLFSPDSYKSSGLSGVDEERDALWRECAKQGTGIVAMKVYGAGWLLRPETPLGVALTPVQCLQYALTRPAVSTCVAGCKTAAEVDAAAAWFNADEGARDFSALAGARQYKGANKCMYCNHCLPCPVGIDVAEVTRALDEYNYGVLKHGSAHKPVIAGASPAECIECGSCMDRCPFYVDVTANMKACAAVL